MLADKNPYIESAYQKLQIISQDKDKRLEYEAREKAIRDYNEGLSEAEEYGIAFRKNTVARIKKPVALLCCNFDTTSACYEIFSANCH